MIQGGWPPERSRFGSTLSLSCESLFVPGLWVSGTLAVVEDVLSVAGVRSPCGVSDRFDGGGGTVVVGSSRLGWASSL